MHYLTRSIASACCLFALPLAVASAQHPQDQQLFKVRVPGLVSINASNSLTVIEHDLTEAKQFFEWQPWQVVCNNASGATVTFETDQAFTHTTNSTIKRDAFLFLSDANTSFFPLPDAWEVTRFTDQTDHKNGDEVAMVAAKVDAASDGDFLLRVVFVEENFAETIAGDYEMTVTGTIAPK